MDWQIIIGLITLALVIFTIVWGTSLWARIERVKIRTEGVTYKMKNSKLIEFEISDLEVQRAGQKEIRYLIKIILKFNEEDQKQLKNYH